jgi:hypothetical protein
MDEDHDGADEETKEANESTEEQQGEARPGVLVRWTKCSIAARNPRQLCHRDNYTAASTTTVIAVTAAGKFDVGHPIHIIGVVFTDSWQHYLQQWEANEARIRLAKFNAETFAERVTEEATVAIEKETSVTGRISRNW